MQITTKSKSTDREITFDYPLGENLAEAIERFGEAVVWDTFTAAAKVRVQSIARTQLNDPETTEEAAIEAAQAYRLGERKERKPRAASVTLTRAKEKIAAAVAAGELSLEELQATIAAMQAAQEAEQTEGDALEA